MQVKASVWTQRERLEAGAPRKDCPGPGMGPCRVRGSAWKVLPSRRPAGQAGPTCPPEGSVLLMLSSGGAGLPWSPVREPRWPASPAGEEGRWPGGASPPGQKPAQLESAERPEHPGAGRGIHSQGTRTRPHPAIPGTCPQETVHPLPVYPPTRLPLTSHGVFRLWQGHRSDVLCLITSSSGVVDL